MENLEKLKNAEKALVSFFCEINNWNIYASEYVRKNGFNIEVKDLIIKPLREILEKYCTEKLYKEISASHSEVSGYDIDFLKIDKREFITKNKIQFFVTELNRSKSTYRYTMIYRNEKWLLDQKQVFRKFNNKWEKSYI